MCVTEEKASFDDVHVEASGSGELLEHAANVTTKDLMEGFVAMEVERDTHFVDAPVLGFHDLLSLAGFNASAPLMGTSQNIDAKENAVPDVEEEEPGVKDDESDEVPDEHERVHGYFGAASGRTTKESMPVVPQCARNKDSTASGQASKSKGKGNGKESTASAQTPKVQKTNLKKGGAGSDTSRIDGRGETKNKTQTTNTNTNPHKQQPQQQTEHKYKQNKKHEKNNNTNNNNGNNKNNKNKQ